MYTKLAPRHDMFAERAESKAKERALQLAALSGREKALEVGVGTGLLFVNLVKALPQGHALGVDRTEAMLAQARARMGAGEGANFRLVQGDARSLPVESASVDVSFCCYLLDLLSEEDIVAVLREMKRVTKAGGKIILANMTHAKNPLHSGYSLLGRISPKLFGGCRPINTTPFLERAGLKLQHQEYLTQSGFPSEVTVAVGA
jgi:ubiquinone/menaquinone biosynthesis C-methylase UbiE